MLVFRSYTQRSCSLRSPIVSLTIALFRHTFNLGMEIPVTLVFTEEESIAAGVTGKPSTLIAFVNILVPVLPPESSLSIIEPSPLCASPRRDDAPRAEWRPR